MNFRLIHKVGDSTRLTYKNIIGKTVLVGIPFLKHDGVFVSMIQFSGVIASADKHRGIAITSENLKSVIDLIPDTAPKGSKDTYVLPPDLSALKPAPEGKYRLKSTGEVIVNPELMTIWTLNAPENPTQTNE